MNTSHPSVASPGPRLTLWLLRAVALPLMLAVIAQPVLAGMYLSGQWDALGLHSGNAVLVETLSFFLLIAALLYWLVGRGRGWVVWAGAGLFVATVLQAGSGYARQLGLHIPVGVAVVTGTVLLTIWVCGRAARIPRRSRRSARGGTR